MFLPEEHILILLLSLFTIIYRFILYFYDLNAKINYKISEKDRIYLSAYSGKDFFGVNYNEADNSEKDFNSKNSSNESSELDFSLGYGNITSTLRWNHLFSEKTFSNTTLTYSRYSFNTAFGVAANQIQFMEMKVIM